MIGLQQDLLVVVERVMSESTIRGGESWKERDGGNIWDELGSRWEGGGLVRVGSLVEKTTTLSSLRQLHTYLLQSFACCFGTRPIINCNHHFNQNIANTISTLEGRLAPPSVGRNVSK